MVLGSRFCYLLELKTIRWSIFCPDNGFHGYSFHSEIRLSSVKENVAVAADVSRAITARSRGGAANRGIFTPLIRSHNWVDPSPAAPRMYENTVTRFTM